MQYARNLIAMLSLLLITAACGDGPTSPSEARDLPAGAVYDNMSVQGCVSDGYCGVLPPISSDPGEPPPPDCNVWYDPDCGACATGGVSSGPDYMSVSSVCPGGGPAPSPGNDGGYAGGGGMPGTTTPPPAPSAYKEGPLAWGACVLAVLGSTYTIDQVASAFLGWWNAQQEYESARRMLDAMQANPADVDPATMQMWEFQVQYYKNRRDDAVAVVEEKTGATGWALLGAGVACGAAAFLPTP